MLNIIIITVYTWKHFRLRIVAVMSFVDFIDIKKTTKVIYSGSTSVQKFRYNAVSCKNICRNELVKEMLAM